MSTQVKYINYFDEEITSQQASQLDQYTEQTYIDGRLKRERKFYDNEIEYFYIYIYPDEDFDAEIGLLTEANFTYIIAKDYAEINDYKTWNFYNYKNGVMGFNYSTRVLDFSGRTIAYRCYNADGTVGFKGYKKYYLDGKALYDGDGEVDIGYADDDYIKFDFSGDSLEIRISFDDGGSFSSLEEFLLSWQENLPFMTPEILAYFTNLDPLVPDITM